MLFYQIFYQSRACKRDWRCNFMMFIRRGDIISCCYVIECHRYYDKVGTILTANLIKKLIEIQYAVYSDIIANCISQNRYEIKCTCRSLSLWTVYDMHITSIIYYFKKVCNFRNLTSNLMTSRKTNWYHMLIRVNW